MTLVYRTVPSLAKTSKKFGTLNKEQQNIEGILYDLGYISFEEVYPFFRRNEEATNTFKLLDENYKFFFLFSYDALMCTFSSIEGLCYEKYNFELLEYNIPKEILLNYCGYGFYKGCAHVEFCIPENEFKCHSLGSIKTELLESKLSKLKGCPIITDYEQKRAYLSEFITGKRNLYDVVELYGENGLLTFNQIIEKLKVKGIITPDNALETYKMFKKSSYEVYKNQAEEVKKMQRTLEKVL